ncbi:carboxylesterase 15-like [Miscanthus floridulus]|uniref:carboxylesterase 15-like n=1 Tax=Miscanthus floridulus TaxID=154761 RepID=UPI0034581F64
MSGITTAPQVVEDLLGVVQLLSDGSVVRADESVLTPPGATFPDVPAVQWRDVVYDPARGLRVRLYRSPVAAPKGGRRLPVLVYFHGGGYCIGAYDQPWFHAFCQHVAAEVPAVVLSVQYRLAPEHRLPAAIEDAATFFSWLRAQAAPAPGAAADPWLAESADFSRTFVSGVSAGANLAHHVVVRIASGQIVPGQVRVAGYVLFAAFFGSDERVASESHPPAGVSLTVESLDIAWRMALPLGATRDHPLANPFGPESPSLEPLPLPAALVVAPGRDVLYDHMLRYAARLKEMGKAVELAEFAGERHGFSVGQWSEATEELMRILKQFINHGAAAAVLK